AGAGPTWELRWRRADARVRIAKVRTSPEGPRSMTAAAAPGLTVADLEAALTRAEPAALLVPPRILRRVIKKDRGLGGPGLQVPHRKGYVIGRDALLRIVSLPDLGVAPDRELPATLLLFPRPDERRLERLPRGETLLKYWRLLFHARVHLA